MHSFTTHESRNLKQARPKGQYVDLLRYTLATPSWNYIDSILPLSLTAVKFLFLNPFINVKSITQRNNNQEYRHYVQRQFVSLIKYAQTIKHSMCNNTWNK